MIYINDKLKLENFRKSKEICVIIDFDRTITTADSTATMGVIPEYIGGDLLKEREKIYNHFRPIEIDYTIDLKERKKLLKTWTEESFTMLCRHIKSEDIIKETLTNCNLYLRDGVKDFFKEMYKKDIPIIVMSAGLGNLIQEFMKKENILYNNVCIVSNFILFKENKAYIDKDKMVATSNKEYSILPENIKDIVEEKNYILLCGDVIEDIKMIDEKLRNKTLTVGFLDRNIESNINIYNKNFDVVLSNNETFETLNKLIKEDI